MNEEMPLTILDKMSLINDKMQGFPDLDETVQQIELKGAEIMDYSREVLGVDFAVFENELRHHIAKRIAIAMEG